MAAVATRTLTYAEAVNEAIRIAMRQDPNVIFLGEDIAGGADVDHLVGDEAWGGALGVTKGIVQEFGRGRVLDTPITESAFIGAAVGAATTGVGVSRCLFAQGTKPYSKVGEGGSYTKATGTRKGADRACYTDQRGAQRRATDAAQG